MAVLSVSGLSLDVGGRRLIEALELRVGAGEAWVILGQNGGGKSTLCRALAGLRPAAPGGVSWFGRPLERLDPPALARYRAYMEQARSDVFGLSALQTVLLARYPFGRLWESDEDVAAATDALRRLDVAHLAERDVRSLSGGERQRVALAAALAQDTPALLLDEPANHLDLPHQMALAAELRRLTRDEGRAALVVAHDLNWAARFASHALLLLPGGRWRAGTADEALTEADLERCLGYPIKRVVHQGRHLWLPADPADLE